MTFHGNLSLRCLLRIGARNARGKDREIGSHFLADGKKIPAHIDGATAHGDRRDSAIRIGVPGGSIPTGIQRGEIIAALGTDGGEIPARVDRAAARH